MALDKEIEILTSLADRLAHISQVGEQKAARLGVEALKRINNPLQYNLANPRVLLPGETDDRPTLQEQSLKRGNEILALGRKMIKETDELLGKPNSPPEGLMPRRVAPKWG